MIMPTCSSERIFNQNALYWWINSHVLLGIDLVWEMLVRELKYDGEVTGRELTGRNLTGVELDQVWIYRVYIDGLFPTKNMQTPLSTP